MNSIKNLLLFILKLSIAGAMVWYLLLRQPGEIFSCLSHLNWYYIAAATAIYLLHMLISAWRWWRLARILNVKISCFEAVSLTLQGCFFSLVIPGGAIGGDVVKMGLISKRSKSGEKFEGVFTILMDRIIGMIALFGLALLLIPLTADTLLAVQIPEFTGNHLAQKILLAALVLLCISGLAASGVIFFHKPLRRIPLADWAMNTGDRLSHGMLTRMTAAADIYAANWKELLLLTAVSVVGVHLMTAVPVWLLLYGLGIKSGWILVITALTIGNIIGLLPIFPAGVGGRDMTAILILTAGGIAAADAKSVQLVYTAILLAVNLANGLFFIFDRGRKQEDSSSEKTI